MNQWFSQEVNQSLNQRTNEPVNEGTKEWPDERIGRMDGWMDVWMDGSPLLPHANCSFQLCGEQDDELCMMMWLTWWCECWPWPSSMILKFSTNVSFDKTQGGQKKKERTVISYHLSSNSPIVYCPSFGNSKLMLSLWWADGAVLSLSILLLRITCLALRLCASRRRRVAAATKR